MNPIRVTAALTHPIQYYSPWFRYITENCPELDLSVVYATRPTAAQQGTGFGNEFQWDIPLLDGYRSRVVRPSAPDDDLDSSTFRGVDVPEYADAVLETRPDVVLVPGWHSITLTRALIACRRRGIPVLYRGDTHLGVAPTGWRRPFRHVRTRALLRMYSAHLAVGQRAREYLVAHGVAATRIFASPHAVDNAFFRDAAAPHLEAAARARVRHALGCEAGEFVVLIVGKLVRRKRVEDAIRAVAALGGDVRLLVAGSGESESALRTAAAELRVRVSWLGFVNQQALGRAYAAADCLLLPSEHESWGLVVNEALATGLPVVVSDTAGCVPDLVVPERSGASFRVADVADCALALARIRDAGGRSRMDSACRQVVATHSFERASGGLVAACESVVPRRRPGVRVVACCGGMVIVAGLERMTFEVLRVVREHGGSVHCIVNGWEHHRIVPLADRIGASWSTGFYGHRLTRRPRNPAQVARMVWDVTRTSAGLLRDAIRFAPTHVLVPDHSAVLRNAPALALLRLFGVVVVFRVANAPERGRFYDALWSRVLPPFVSVFVPNSQFSRARLEETGVPAGKITLIRNALSRRDGAAARDRDVIAMAARRPTILAVGQIAPFKGTHLVVDAVLRLLEDGLDVQAMIVGALPSWPPELVEYVSRLQARVETAGAGDRVLFVGAREDVPGIMRASYVLAAPILQEETFGNVALEARSVGLPVVAFDRGGLRELVRDGHTGCLCSGTDLDGLTERLRFLVRNPGERERMSANSLAATADPGNDCTAVEFRRRWWVVFAPPVEA